MQTSTTKKQVLHLLMSIFKSLKIKTSNQSNRIRSSAGLYHDATKQLESSEVNRVI